MSAAVKQGHELFFGKAGCSQCHVSGNNFTDTAFHNIGIGWNPETMSVDPNAITDVSQARVERSAIGCGALVGERARVVGSALGTDQAAGAGEELVDERRPA
mgnify:CR=1 FL=1